MTDFGINGERAAMKNPVREYRLTLARKLTEWRDAGGHVEEITDLIEGLISVKVDEILRAREDNARAGISAGASRDE